MQYKIQTTLTTNILIPQEVDNQDGKPNEIIYFTNVYNEWAKFIGIAELIDNEQKVLKQIRFESDKPFIKKKVNIHQEWLDFDKRVSAFIHQFPDCFNKKDSFKAIKL